MFKKKTDTLINVHFYPGIYKFELPYLANYNVPDDKGIVPVYNCDVEIHIGDQRDLDNKYLASVFISAKKGGVGTTNFIEDLATKIQKMFIDELTHPENGPIHKHIRWIERNFYPNENYKLVNLTWDEKAQKYYNPQWHQIDDMDWIMNNHQLAPY
jgi:hypothetical protein